MSGKEHATVINENVIINGVLRGRILTKKHYLITLTTIYHYHEVKEGKFQ